MNSIFMTIAFCVLFLPGATPVSAGPPPAALGSATFLCGQAPQLRPLTISTLPTPFRIAMEDVLAGAKRKAEVSVGMQKILEEKLPALLTELRKANHHRLSRTPRHHGSRQTASPP